MGLYSRISQATGLVESIDVFSGKLVRISKVDDLETVPTYTLQCKTGSIEVSALIAESTVSFMSNHDVNKFLPYTSVVIDEICNLIGEGVAIADLSNRRLGKLPLPPDHVIYKWMEHDSKFKVRVDQARRQAARNKFDQALSIALESKGDPKTLKALVDILRRHAEVDDAEVFQIKSKEVEATPPVINITFNTGVPQKEDVKDITPQEVIDYG